MDGAKRAWCQDVESKRRGGIRGWVEIVGYLGVGECSNRVPLRKKLSRFGDKAGEVSVDGDERSDGVVVAGRAIVNVPASSLMSSLRAPIALA
ncbi:hypothetical protein CSA17_02930 [bacterium DOLJORAL78_65_58]|nr:MAG: hypothetical protein CSA17_02930 [bacterium DOLJORAL78_65_58]